MQTIVIPNVKQDRLDHYMAWATVLGGKIVSVANEDDGEFTVVILVTGT
ncbi:hypothetical protein [Novosphingobium sp.]|nr:hypothetical protein [Novosphingobium sp.]MCC6925293.1 hypothetical protein [Novosphingobium sp.]